MRRTIQKLCESLFGHETAYRKDDANVVRYAELPTNVPARRARNVFSIPRDGIGRMDADVRGRDAQIRQVCLPRFIDGDESVDEPPRKFLVQSVIESAAASRPRTPRFEPAVS